VTISAAPPGRSSGSWATRARSSSASATTATSTAGPSTAAHRYTITFPPQRLPAVGAFWSITLYDPAGHLYANPLRRFVLGSRQVPTMVHDDDDTLTILVQHDQLAREWIPNWLPCPSGQIGLTFRTHLPSAAIRDGSWTAPPVRVPSESP
jgi:hypothetical protein